MIRPTLTWRFIAAFVATLVILGLLYVVLERTIFALDEQTFFDFITRLGWRGPLVMVGLITVEVIIAPLPGGWLSIASGYIFGPAAGFFYAYLGNVLGALIAFELAQVFGLPFVRHLLSEEKYQRYSKKIHRTSLGLVLLYAIPLFPIDVMSLLLGLSGLPRRRFATIILIGFIPNMAILNFVGGAVATPEYRYVMLALIGVVVGYFLLRTMRDALTPTVPTRSKDKPE